MRSRLLKEMTGKCFGSLVVLGRSPNRKNKKDGHAQWYCLCDCGKETIIEGTSLRTGRTKSCGCSHLKHGFAKRGKTTREYNVWNGIKRRCHNKSSLHYKNYGNRGISVCRRWRESFLSFLEDMGKCPKGMTIERINNNGNYEPSNCKWATRYEQSRNTRRNVWIKYDGKKMVLEDFANKIGITHSAIHDFCQRNNITLEEAVNFYHNKYAQ